MASKNMYCKEKCEYTKHDTKLCIYSVMTFVSIHTLIAKNYKRIVRV